MHILLIGVLVWLSLQLIIIGLLAWRFHVKPRQGVPRDVPNVAPISNSLRPAGSAHGPMVTQTGNVFHLHK